MIYQLTQEEIKKSINYWQEGAEEDFETAKTRFENKRYHHCLFFCHLFLEKILKANVVKNTRNHPLFIHNLLKLAADTKLSFDDVQRKNFALINEFNIRARYNDYKGRF